MNHPKPEEFVPYLYGESTPDARRHLKAHLKACAECREQVESWRRSVNRLDAWQLPRTRTPIELFGPVLKWAAAAVLLLGLGFGFGRFSGQQALAEKVRTRVEPQLRETLRQEMAQMVQHEFARNSSAILLASSDQAEKLLAAYNSVNETRRTEDLERLYLALKKQLDIVAINTQQEFVQLAAYRQPAANPSKQ